MKILVIGGSGFIGSHVLAYVSSNHETLGTFYTNADVRVPKCRYQQLDVTDATAVRDALTRLQPEVAVLVCGSQSIEGCEGIDGREKEAEEALRVHVNGTQNVVAACELCACRLVYVSTDSVFDGSKLFFSEEDETNPVNAYGRMKRNAEEIIQASGLNQVIVRVSLTFGWRRHRKQFHNFALRVLDRLSQGDGTLSAATNLFNTPIEVASAASAIAQIALRRDEGMFHVASRDQVSRYEFARSVAEVFGFLTSRVVPCEDSSGLRQPNSCLSVERAESVLSTRFEGFHEGLLRMKREQASLG